MTLSGETDLAREQVLLQKYRDLHDGKGQFYYKTELHDASPNLWDGRCFGLKVLPLFRKVVAKRDSFRVIDWGCGKAKYMPSVMKEFAGRVQSWYLYDPGTNFYNEAPTDFCDIILCCDVMEHISDDGMAMWEALVAMDFLLVDDGIAIFSISGEPDARSFVDGVNMHTNLKSFEEWKVILKQNFEHKKVILIYNNRQYWESWHAAV